MKNKNTTILLVLLVVIILGVAGMWFSGGFEKIFSAETTNTVGNTLALDLETLQTTIKAVSSPIIENLAFVEAIDTLSSNADLTKLRNPFVKVYVAPPPKPKPQEPQKPKKKKPSRKSIKRKKRIVRPKITINGIIWDRSAPYAILNNDIYGEGDQIQGYTVQTIQDTMIVLGNSNDIFSIVIERE